MELHRFIYKKVDLKDVNKYFATWEPLSCKYINNNYNFMGQTTTIQRYNDVVGNGQKKYS